ncbi:MAG: hypothetical protein M1438_03185 [Deltaproteobacteria bacterium]|nr:hypothetical protein [Deltaproteobacteria bacterium]
MNGASVFPRKPVDFPAAMERQPRAGLPRDLAAEEAALRGPQMFDCTRFPGTARISERQCLINQERAAAGGFPSFCVDCPEGAEIKGRHAGEDWTVKKAWNYDAGSSRMVMKKKAEAPETAGETPAPPKEEKNMTEIMAGSPTSRTDDLQVQEATAPPGPENEVMMMNTNPNSPEKPEQLSNDSLPPEAPRCKRHPEEPQVQIGGSGPRAGQYIGRCQICMKEAGAVSAAKRKANNEDRKQAMAAPEEKLDLPVIQAMNPETKAALVEIAEKFTASPGVIYSASDWRDMLLAKFPDFDPAWSPELQGKWLDSFNKLVNLFGEKIGWGARLNSRLRPKWGKMSKNRPGAELRNRRRRPPKSPKVGGGCQIGLKRPRRNFAGII